MLRLAHALLFASSPWFRRALPAAILGLCAIVVGCSGGEDGGGHNSINGGSQGSGGSFATGGTGSGGEGSGGIGVGTGGTGAGGAGSGGAPIDFGSNLALQDFTEAFAQVMCAPCGPPRQGQDETCVQRMVASLDPALATTYAGVAAGVITYDGAAAAQCFANHLANCDETLDLFRFCGAFTGSRGVGEGCLVNRECAEGMYCSGAIQQCGGTCTPIHAESEACSNYGNPECEEGLYCDGATCKRWPTLGDPCVPTPGCKTGICAKDGSGSMTCQALEDLTYAELGQSCHSIGPRCVEGLVCENVTYTCVPHAAPQGACTPATPNMCPAGEWCDFAQDAETGTCRPRPKVGTPCVTSRECDEGSGGMYCDDGTCALLRRIGESCDSSNDCTSDKCTDSVCVDRCLGD